MDYLEEEAAEMNANRKTFRLMLLGLVLTFVVAGMASAGAIFKRGSDQKDDSDKTTVTKSGNSRSESRGSSGSQVQSERAKPSEQARPTEQARSTQSARPGQGQTMKDRTIDAVPSDRTRTQSSDRTGNRNQSIYDPRPQDKSIYDYRPQDKSIYDPKPEQREAFDRDARNRNDSKYTRTEERPRQETSFHSGARYVGGYYHYDRGWAHTGDFACRYGNWVFDYAPRQSFRSAFFYYGYFPYVPVTQVVVINRPRVVYVEVPIVVNMDSYDDGAYYLERSGSNSIDRTLADIRSSWLRGDPTALLNHVRSDISIDVLLDGDYSYTVTGSDYRGMVSDAVRATKTSGFVFDSVRRRGDDKIIAYGRHTAYSSDGDKKVVYVSYLLERRGGEWIVTEVGSSAKRVGY
jgi:hypothetical protein